MRAIICDNCLKAVATPTDLDNWFILEQKASEVVAVQIPDGCPPNIAAIFQAQAEAEPQLVTRSHAELCSDACCVEWIKNGCRSDKRDDEFPNLPAQMDCDDPSHDHTRDDLVAAVGTGAYL